MRLNVFISKSGYCSRRKADMLIKNHKVTVDEKMIDKPYYEVSQNSSVYAEGKSIKTTKEIYFVFNKPKNVITTRKDIFADKKITDFFPKTLSGIFPVGRLDKNTSGLIILTNDGGLCYQATHPKFQIEKEYEVAVKGNLNPADIDKAIKGIFNEGELLKVRKIILIKKQGDKTFCNAIVCEGKKRHLRRLFFALGYPLLSLKRVRIGNLRIGSLKEGEYKAITREQIYHLLFGDQRLK